MNRKLLDMLAKRVLVVDGAMGTALHARDLPLSDYEGLENCSEILNLTRPDIIEDIHASFLRIGCDGVETNTFGGMKHVLAEFQLEDRCYGINKMAAQIARKVCDEFETPDKPRLALGSIGPGTKLPTLRQIDWDTLEDSYTEQARGLIDGGVDALVIETCQDLLQAKTVLAAANAAMKLTNRFVPLVVQFTMETFGTMLVGSDVSAALTTLEAFPEVSVIGVNCATGPREMSEHIRFLAQHCKRYLSVMPNAGLPELLDGKPHYRLTPADLAKWLTDFVETEGVNLVGGCCGTTPEHLAAVVERVGNRSPSARQALSQPAVSSIYSATTIKQDTSFLIVGERTNTNGSRQFKGLLEAGDFDGMVKMARAQVKEGAHVLDVCGAYVGRDEIADMKEIVGRFATEVQIPLMIDSTELPVLEASLKLAGGKCIINSINLEDGEGKLDGICVLARKYGAALVALTIDESGMAKDAQAKLDVARRIYDLCVQRHGIQPHDLIFDALTFTICTGNEDDRGLGAETLESIKRIKAELPGVHTLLGVSNVSFGLLPAARSTLNSVFLHHAVQQGLDAAIVHVAGIKPVFKIPEQARRLADDLIYDRRRFDDDGNCTYDPLHELIEHFEDSKTAKPQRPTDLPVNERLKNRIIDGDRAGLEDELNEALRAHPALDIVNNILLDGMKVVGDLFGSGQMQLPFVLQSAETMKAAVSHLEPHMDKVEGQTKGKIVLATVKGDVHDIGKNLVDIILTNNGYTVFNLGIKQPINTIIDKFDETQADAIGLSGLLVKSTVIMKDNLEVLNERGITAPVILGGAALTRSYVEQDLRQIYRGRLEYAKDAFTGLSLMGEISAGDKAVRPPRRRREDAALSASPTSAGSTAAVAASKRPANDVPIPQPPFWGKHIATNVPLGEVVPFINDIMLFQVQWQYKRARRSDEEFQAYLQEEVRPVLKQLLEQCQREHILEPKYVYGYWPCNGDGNDLIVFDADVQDREIARFTFPREQKQPHRCIADYFRPLSSGEKDVVAFSLVTMGQRVGQLAAEWFAGNRYRDYLHLHGLGVEGAEALAECLHSRIRKELGIAQHDADSVKELFKQGYQGSRYSFGYPACPNLEDQAKLWPLLDPAKIGVALSEEYQLDPEQSTSALICHHAEARYFSAR